MTQSSREGAIVPSERRARRSRMVRDLCILVVGAWAFLGVRGGGRSWAYPQWQLSSGAVRCAQCHFSPGGGGLVTDYGRDFMGQDQTTFGGNGALLHGAARLPRGLALGGDLRGAFVAEDVQDPNGVKTAVFPMQSDAQVFASVSDFSFYGSAGLRGQVRPNESLVPDQNYQPISTSRLISREHYFMWRPGVLGPYVRAGRFYAPFGLRLAEHVLYIRRDLGFNQLEESYNLSAGRVGEQSEVHVTAFAPDFLRHIGGRSWGLAAYGERRFLDDTLVAGVQGKLEFVDDTTRVIGGLIGKRFVEGWKTLFFAETDGIFLTTKDGNSPQFVGLAGGSVFPARGLMLTLLGERRQTDLRVRDTSTNGGAFLVNWFPYAHVELELMWRWQVPAGGATAQTLLIQAHYIL